MGGGGGGELAWVVRVMVLVGDDDSDDGSDDGVKQCSQVHSDMIFVMVCIVVTMT